MKKINYRIILLAIICLMLTSKNVFSVFLPSDQMTQNVKDEIEYKSYDEGDTLASECDVIVDLKKIKKDEQLPYFTCTIDEIIFGKVFFSDLNFFGGDLTSHTTISGDKDFWWNIKEIVQEVFSRVIEGCLVLMIGVLIYYGIRKIGESLTLKRDDLTAERVLGNWIKGFLWVVLLPFLMGIIVNLSVVIRDIAGDTSDKFNLSVYVAELDEDGEVDTEDGSYTFKTNLTGFIRYRIQAASGIGKLVYMLLYVVLTIFTFLFILIYFLIFMIVVMMTAFSPIVSLVSAWRTSAGKRNRGHIFSVPYYLGIYSALVFSEALNSIIYYTFVRTSQNIVANNPIFSFIIIIAILIIMGILPFALIFAIYRAMQTDMKAAQKEFSPETQNELFANMDSLLANSTEDIGGGTYRLKHPESAPEFNKEFDRTYKKLKAYSGEMSEEYKIKLAEYNNARMYLVNRDRNNGPSAIYDDDHNVELANERIDKSRKKMKRTSRV